MYRSALVHVFLGGREIMDRAFITPAGMVSGSQNAKVVGPAVSSLETTITFKFRMILTVSFSHSSF